MDGWILRMDKLVQGIDVFPELPCHTDQLVCSKMFQSGKVLLHINDGIEISSVSNIHPDGTKAWTLNRKTGLIEVSRNIGESD